MILAQAVFQLFCWQDCFTINNMSKLEKGDNSAKYLQNFAKLNQVIYTLVTICVPISMILAQAVHQLCCCQDSIGFIQCTSRIRPVAGQGSLPEMRFSFLKHFRILYPFISNTIQINQRLCNNWHCKDLKQKNSKSVTLILRSCTGIGMVLHKILDKALSSRHNLIKSIEGFAKNWNCKTFITKLLYKNSESVTFWVGNGTI